MRSTPALETAVAPPKLTRSQFIGTLAGLVLAMLLAALDQTVVGTAMPRIVAELGGFAQYTWTVTIYLIASTLTGPVVGRLSDTFGRKRFYLAGIGIFLVASWLCGAAWDMTSLIIFRGIQGLGAGVMQMVAFTVIADLFPPARRGQAQGIFASLRPQFDGAAAIVSDGRSHAVDAGIGIDQGSGRGEVAGAGQAAGLTQGVAPGGVAPVETAAVGAGDDTAPVRQRAVAGLARQGRNGRRRWCGRGAGGDDCGCHGQQQGGSSSARHGHSRARQSLRATPAARRQPAP